MKEKPSDMKLVEWYCKNGDNFYTLEIDHIMSPSCPHCGTSTTFRKKEGEDLDV